MLAANTTYFVVIDVTGTGGNFNHHRISNDITDSNSEDSGAYAGWSIANGSLTRQFQTSSWTNRGFSWKMENPRRRGGPGPPAAPATPTLSGTDGTSLTITWTATAGAVTDYDVRYRRKGDTAWTDQRAHRHRAHDPPSTGLLQGASWEAQVAASNAGGPGQWSPTGSGHTGPARVREGAHEHERDWDYASISLKDIENPGTGQFGQRERRQPVPHLVVLAAVNSWPSASIMRSRLARRSR